MTQTQCRSIQAGLYSSEHWGCTGLEAGFDADDLVAQELGKRKASDLSPALAQYKDKVKAKLEQASNGLHSLA